LRENLRYTLANRKVALTFSLWKHDTEVEQYRVRKRFAFLLADNWAEGFDSRYFGPVSCSAIEGKAVAIVWSTARRDSAAKEESGRRILTFIR
jgi:hypothetical protein